MSGYRINQENETKEETNQLDVMNYLTSKKRRCSVVVSFKYLRKIFFYQITLNIVQVRLGKQARILSEKKGVFSSVGVTTMVLPSLKNAQILIE